MTTQLVKARTTSRTTPPRKNTNPPTPRQRLVSKTVYKDNTTQCAFITTGNSRCKRAKSDKKDYCVFHCKQMEQGPGYGGKKLPPKNSEIKAHEYDYYKDEPDEFDSTAAYVAGGVWIGSIDSIHDPEFLKRHGIKSILNTSGMEPGPRIQEMYKRLGIVYNTISKSEYNPKTKKYRVVKFLSDEPFGYRFTPRDYFKFLNEGVQHIKNSPKPTIVNCFPENDHQLLTNKGFMFLKDIENYDKDDLLMASYDKETQQIVYDTFELVINPHDTYEMIEFTSYNEERFWASTSDEYGFREDTTDIANRSNRVSIITTPGHRMYVKRGLVQKPERHIYWKSYKQWNEDRTKHRYVQHDYKAVEASELLSDNERDCIKMLGCASNGIKLPDNVTLPFIKQLELKGEDQINAFLELYGYWLGDGSLQVNRKAYHKNAVTFSPVKPVDTPWIIKRLEIIGSIEHKIYKSKVNLTQSLFSITDKRWTNFFVTEYQRKYKHGIKTAADIKLNEENPQAKSAKWMCDWVWSLTKDQGRCVLAGLRMADGDEACDGNAIYTSSVSFRDEIVRLALNAGYSPTFIFKYGEGSCRGIIKGKEVIANHDSWRVAYNSTGQQAKPNLRQKNDVKKVQYTGRTWCVTVPHDFVIVRRARYSEKKKKITLASRPLIINNCQAGINRSASVVSAFLMTKPKPYTYERTMELLEKANNRRNLRVLTNKDFRTSLKYYPVFAGTTDNEKNQTAYKTYMRRFE